VKEIVSPRLSRLLEILLAQEGPVSIDSLAHSLDASRRTIFREIENADAVLSRYNVEVDSKPGRGIQLLCAPEEKERFLEALRSGPLRPGVRRQRLLCLLVRLLESDGVIQKLYYYSSGLGVSESTVSNDLALLEPFLAEYKIRLVRRPGAGVYVVGDEERIRAALAVRLVLDGQEDAAASQADGKISYFRTFDYPPEDIEEGVRDMMADLELPLGWMTEESRAFFAVYLMVTVERVRAGRILEKAPPVNDAPEARRSLSSAIASEAERRFSVEFNEAERLTLLSHLQSCRSRELAPPGDEDVVTDDVKSLVYRMIDAFDPALSPRLRVDEQLVDGLSRHLAPAIIRLAKRIELPSCAEKVPSERYPNFYKNIARAIEELKIFLNVDTIPENEVSYIAVYFFTALLCLDEQNIHKRTLRAGIVCLSGIGVSYMIASQLRKRYKGELEIEISGWNDQDAWERMDFLVSTMPLDYKNREVIQVHAILEDEDFHKIRDFINTHAFVPRGNPQKSERRSLSRRIEKTVPVLEQTWALLDTFKVHSCEADLSLPGLCGLSGALFGEGPGGGDFVRHDLLSREALSSQVVETLGIALLHVRTKGVATPVFAVITPEGGVFTEPVFKGAKCAVLMLLPQGGPPEMNGVMGRLSSALVDLPLFLEAAQRGDEATLRAIAEAELACALVQYCDEKLTN